MKKTKETGITLIALVVTIVILIILAGVGTYSGINSIQSSKLTKFRQELEIMQAEVDMLYEKYKDEDTIDIGKALTGSSEEETAFNAVGVTDTTNYTLFDSDVIESLDMAGIEGEYLVSIKDRQVISLEGFESDGVIYYTLEQLTGKSAIEEGIDRGEITVGNISHEETENGYKIILNDIECSKYVGLYNIKYKKDGDTQYKTLGTRISEKNFKFEVKETGKYIIVITDEAGITCEIEEIIGIYVTLYTDGTLVFSNSDETIEEKEVSKTYGNILEKDYEGVTWVTGVQYTSDLPWYNDRESILKVEMYNKIEPITTNGWFFDCENLTEITNIKNMNTSKVTDMYNMFGNCYNLESIDLSNFDTKNVTIFTALFSYCEKLETIDVSGFDTTKAEKMNAMFRGLTVETINISNFDTKKVSTMSLMFSDCSNLKEIIGLDILDTSQVTDMSYMFRNCSIITNIDVSKFDTNSVTRMEYMFFGCNELESIDLSNFNTSKVTSMNHMFCLCESLTTLDISNFNTKKVTDMGCMFQHCSSLSAIYVGTNWSTSQVTSTDYMFDGCGVQSVTYI